MEQPQKPVFAPARREHVVNQIFGVLKDWRSSPFENEGPCVAGLRAALCIEGHGWDRAHLEATTIVGEGLRILAADRPSWAEGQRSYSGGADYCAWCGIDIPEDHQKRAHYKFCSELCAKRSRLFNEDDDSDRQDRIGDQAYRVIRRGRSQARICKHCGGPFQPASNTENTIYCSHKCYTDHKRILPERPCRQCGKGFRPRRAAPNSLFCSSDCHLAFADGKRLTRHCEFCGKGFFAASGAERFCSEIHAVRADGVGFRDADNDLLIAAE
jgi:hypothetical protein